ncbi:MAG: hypothetical protein HXX11_22490 [Desulfuromonadales bacterium]|nr:hypothetical protein [Desulfuromonadales bacterium]
MKKIICIALAVTALLLAGTSPSHAFRGGHGGHGGHGGVGVWIGPGWGPGWWGPYYPFSPYYPYYTEPPIVIQQQPDTYIQQTPQTEQPSYWYFCREPEGYYPYVKKCPKGWLKVVPPETPEDGEEE